MQLLAAGRASSGLDKLAAEELRARARQVHVALARELSEIPQRHLADSGDSEVPNLVAACAEASYETGSLFLHALKARQDAARLGSSLGIMRWTRIINAARARVQADAEGVPVVAPQAPDQLPLSPVVGRSSSVRYNMLKRGRLIGAGALVAAGWLALALYVHERNFNEAEIRLERIRPEHAVSDGQRRDLQIAETVAAHEPVEPAVVKAPEITNSVHGDSRSDRIDDPVVVQAPPTIAPDKPAEPENREERASAETPVHLAAQEQRPDVTQSEPRVPQLFVMQPAVREGNAWIADDDKPARAFQETVSVLSLGTESVNGRAGHEVQLQARVPPHFPFPAESAPGVRILHELERPDGSDGGSVATMDSPASLDPQERVVALSLGPAPLMARADGLVGPPALVRPEASARPGELDSAKLVESGPPAGNDGASVASEDSPATVDVNDSLEATSPAGRPGVVGAERQVGPAPIVPWREAPTPGEAAPNNNALLVAGDLPGGDRPTDPVEVMASEEPEGELQSQQAHRPKEGVELRRVQGEAVRLRRKPSLSAPILGVFSSGKELKVGRKEGAWSYVIAQDGQTGWMATEFLGDASAGTPEAAGTSTKGAGSDSDEREVSSEGSSPNFIVDTSPPEPPKVLGFAPDSGVSGDGLTNHTELVLTGTAEPGSTVTIRDGNRELGTAPADPSGAWSFSTGVMAEGAYSFTTTSSDAAGNVGPASDALAVAVDTRAPSAALSRVQNDAVGAVVAAGGLTNDNTPMLSGTAEAGSTVEVILTSDSSPDVVLAPSLSGTDWSVTPDEPLTDGPYKVTVKATDAAGNVTRVSGESWK